MVNFEETFCKKKGYTGKKTLTESPASGDEKGGGEIGSEKVRLGGESGGICREKRGQ